MDAIRSSWVREADSRRLIVLNFSRTQTTVPPPLWDSIKLQQFNTGD